MGGGVMIPVAEALARILSACAPLPAETVFVTEALGRVLAEPVVAWLTQPPFANAAMDGWAVRAADLVGAQADAPAALTRIGESAAGHPFAGRLGPGQAVRIFTGAAIPDGADAVVMQEDATAQGDRVLIPVAPRPGRFIRPAGLDFTAGDLLIPAGRRLTARDVALAAGANAAWVRVHRRPRVAVLATGDEIRLPGEPLEPGQIVSSNAIALCGLVTVEGGVPHNLGVAADTPDALAALAAGGVGADLLVTAGGAAQGDHDHVRAVLGRDLTVDGVAMRPGKGVLFGTGGGQRFLGLPGNPVSAAVAAVVFLRPILRALQGMAPGDDGTVPATLGAALPPCDERADFVRATLTRGNDGGWVATPFSRQDSAMMSRLARADGLIVRQPFVPAAAVGERVAVLPLTGGAVGL